MVDLSSRSTEGILIGQITAANEAAMRMYHLAWRQPPEYLDARMKYLGQADKTMRTVMMLTERLDHHRGQGQQQIVVKHITVNADQAVVTDTVVAGKNTEEITAAKLLVVRSDKPMEVIEPAKEALAVGGGYGSKMSINPMERAHASPRCRAKSKHSGLRCKSPAVRGYRVCRMHGARGGAPLGERNGNYRHGARSKESMELEYRAS